MTHSLNEFVLLWVHRQITVFFTRQQPEKLTKFVLTVRFKENNFGKEVSSFKLT